MGGACCVAARDKTIVSTSGSEVLQQNIRHSPTWSFRWENRGRVAGEDTSITRFSDVISRTSGSDIKHESAGASGDRSPLESFGRPIWQKFPVSEGTTMPARTPCSDQSISRNVSMDASLDQVRELEESPSASNPSFAKLFAFLPSTSSLPTSSFSFTNHPHPASLTTSRWHSLMGKGFENRSPELKSSSSFLVTQKKCAIPSWSNEATQGSHSASSDGCSMQTSADLLAASHGKSPSFDDEYMDFDNRKSTPNDGRVLVSSSVELQVCGICTKPLADRSFWNSQKLVASICNELPVVAVLICGHLYHAECLEIMTPGISKYDPSCPICSLGVKQTLMLSQKAIKVDLDMKARHKGSKNHVVEADFEGDPFEFDGLKGHGDGNVKGPKMASSSSIRSSLAKPFLRGYFSVGSKSQTTKRKGFLWTRTIRG